MFSTKAFSQHIFFFKKDGDCLEKILLVSGSEKTTKVISGLIIETGEYQIFTANNGVQASQIAVSADFNAVIINTPLADEFGTNLAEKIAQTTASCVIIIVKAELSAEISAKYDRLGIIVLPKPISKPLFFQSFKLACNLHRRLVGLKSENNQLKVKIDEIKLVDRAKCVLIQYLGMTEPMAHRYIEKQAMDMRLSKITIAENILKTYEY